MDYHDMLAEVGAANAHPGGRSASEVWMSAIKLDGNSRVLDVGCGTGATSIELVERFGCHVTGLDVRPKMLKKAKKRASLHGCEVKWIVGSAERLPLPSGSFDLVISESVNVFVQRAKAIGEYYRVLCSGGAYVDIEMMVMAPVSDEWRESVAALYGARDVPDLRGWRKSYQDAGFATTHVLQTKTVSTNDFLAADGQSAGPVEITSPGVYQNPQVMAIMEANAKWLEQNHHMLGYGVFLCTKVDRGH